MFGDIIGRGGVLFCFLKKNIIIGFSCGLGKNYVVLLQIILSEQKSVLFCVRSSMSEKYRKPSYLKAKNPSPSVPI